MKCDQCAAFESAFKTAGVRYAAATYTFEERINASPLRDAKSLTLEREAVASRLDYKLAREALRVHCEGHSRKTWSGTNAKLPHVE